MIRFSYVVETLRGTDGVDTRAENGLRMDFDVPAWTVQKEEMQDIMHWLDKVVEARTLDALRTGKEELCVKLENGNFFHIQTCEDGWDYTLYDAEYKEIDGGQLDEPGYTMADASKEILNEFQCSVENLTPVLTNELFTRVEEADQKVAAAFQNKLQIAEDKCRMQDSALHKNNEKNTLERI